MPGLPFRKCLRKGWAVSGISVARERRWLFVVEDGRHGTVGRHSDPTDEEIARVGQELDGLGLAGWLAVTSSVRGRTTDPAALIQTGLR
jgi:hypothetical protein